MVLGLRSKNKKGASVQVEYTIHIQEIKPWPPSQSLKSLRSVVLQWVNGDRRSGSMGPVTPSLSEGKIEFNESFKLQVVLLKDTSVKGYDFVAFQKNVLELNLYELRRDRTAKGQLLGTALIDLAEHGLIKEAVRISIPVSSKRSFRNTAQPVLYVKIQRLDEEGGSSSSRESLSKEASLEKDGRESVSALMTEEYAEEAEIASFTDDDISSHSSLTNSSSALEPAADMPVQNGGGEVEKDKNISEAVDGSGEAGAVHSSLPVDSPPPKPDFKQESATFVLHDVADHPNGSLPQSASTELTIDSGNLDADSPENKLAPSTQNYENLTIHPYSSTVTSEVEEEGTVSLKHNEDVDGTDSVQEAEKTINNSRGDEHAAEKPTEDDLNLSGRFNQVESSVDLQNEKLNGGSISEAVHGVDQAEKSKESRNVSEQVDSSNYNIVVEESLEQEQIKTNTEESVQEVRDHSSNGECLAEDLSGKPSIASPTGFTYTPPYQKQSYLQNDLKPHLPSYRNMSSRRFRGEDGNRSFANEKLRNLKFSVRSQSESFGSITFTNDNQYEEEVKEIDVQEDIRDGGKNLVTDDGIDDQESTTSSSDKLKRNSKNQRDTTSDEKIHELELRVEMLERELREAAAIEIGLYSVVAEHGSSVQKVHTPARRLSRLYIHASRYWSRERRATTARSAVSGLVMAAKTCGNDVPRLSFWLSNSVVLRAIITLTSGHQGLPTSASPYHAADASQIVPRNKSSPLKWESSTCKKDYSLAEEYEDWEDPNTFITALERIESWIFSRIIESIWWQTLTPHMQSVNEAWDLKMGSRSRKTCARTPSLVDQEQANLSIEIWKRAFREACGRLCPVRAEGHECGCLPILARLVMEQCIARLDVAMFNAILRESDDEIPTDPVSDPISDSKVLPIPSGKSSFGAGAQLKNAIGNWSRWLTDLFGIDTDDFHEDDNQHEDDRMDVAETFKSFHLLNALSDLLMLPKDMLLESSIRGEVCPTFSASMIKRILDSFQPDEFCPDPIPHEVFEALDSEDPHDNGKDRITNFPCSASSIIYSPPPVASVEAIIGDVRSASLLRRSGSSVVRKCQTSDDELDELDSPLTSIMSDKSFTPTDRPKGMGAGNAVRYQLLREVWRLDDELP